MVNLERLDSRTVTLHTGETLTLQRYTEMQSNYLIKELESYTDSYSIMLRHTLKNTLGKKWSEVRNGLDKIEDTGDKNYFELEYSTSMIMELGEIIHPITDQDEELSKDFKVVKK